MIRPWTAPELKARIYALKLDRSCLKVGTQSPQRLKSLAVLQAEIDKLEAELTQLEKPTP